MRTVYLRASTETSASIPPSTEPPRTVAADDGVINLVNQPAVANPSATRLMAMDNPERSDAVMEVFAWQTAQAMLADPLQTLRTQRAPMAESVTALLDETFV